MCMPPHCQHPCVLSMCLLCLSTLCCHDIYHFSIPCCYISQMVKATSLHGLRRFAVTPTSFPGRLCYNNHIVHPMILLAVELCLPIGVVVVVYS